MTAAFDALREAPRTTVDLSDLAYDERVHVRRIAPTVGTATESRLGRLTPVVYLIGDERAAAALFAEVNADALRDVPLDAPGRNPIESNVARPIYDWILHALGRRRLDPYDTVVIEYRPDEDVTWCIDRRAFTERVDRRYSTSHPRSARIDGTLPELYADLLASPADAPQSLISRDAESVPAVGSDADIGGISSDTDPEALPDLDVVTPVTLTPDDLAGHDRVAGSRRQPLDAFRVDPRFDVEPTAVDDEIALHATGFDDHSPSNER